MKDILSYDCRFDNLETEVSIKSLDGTGYETTLKKEFIRKISFDYYSNVYVIKGYYPNNDVDECFKGVELERWASLKNNHKDAVKKVRIRWVRGKQVDRETELNACAIKYKEEIDNINHHFYLLLVDVDREREIAYNNTITVNNSNLLYITMKPYIENESLNSVLRKLDNKHTSISDLKGNYALLNNLAKTKIATKRSITSEEYWKMELLISSLTTEFKSVFFKLNINFNKAGYDGLLNNGRPLNILRRIISILARYISKEAIKDLENIKKNLDTKKVLSSRQLKEKVREIIKREDLIIQPRLNSISVCKNNNGGGTGMSMSQGSSSRIKWGEEVVTNQTGLQQKAVNTENPDFHQKFDPRPAEKEFSINNDDQLSLWEELYEGVSYREFDDFIVLKVGYEAVENNSIVIETHINDKPYKNGKPMTVANTISTLPYKDDIIYGGTGTYFYRHKNNTTSFNYRALGYIINDGQDMTPQELSSVNKYYNITENRSFIGYNEDGYLSGRGKDIFNSNLIWGIGGLTSIMEKGEFTSYNEMTNNQGQFFTPNQLYSTWHMMFGIDRNKNQELYIFMNTTNFGFRNIAKDRRKEVCSFIEKLGLTDVAKGDGGGSSQWWLNNGFSKQNEARPLGNMVLIRKGQGK